MGFVDTIAAHLGYHKAQPSYPQMLLATAEAARWSIPSRQLPQAQAELYQRLSWVAIAVQMISEATAVTKFNVKELSGEKSTDVLNHPFEQLLGKPNPLMSRFEFITGTVGFRALTGNAYWFLNAPRGEGNPPAELWLLPPHSIVPVPDAHSYIAGYDYDPGSGSTIPIPTWQIVHFRRWHPGNSFVGLSPIEALATTAQADMNMQKWNAAFFGENNAKIPGALAYSDMVNATDWEVIREDIKTKWGGTNRSGPMLMRGTGQGGVNWIPMALSQKDMEFLAGRQASKEEIFQVFGVPPGLVDKNTTEANAQAAKAVFAEYTLWPLLCSLAEVITNNLLALYGENLRGEFDDPRKTDRLVDLQEQQQYALTHTIDEIRAQYYAEAPLSDDRGLFLPAEIGTETLLKLEDGKIPEPKPVPEALVPFAGQNNQAADESAEEPGQTETPEPLEEADAEAMKADLLRWQTKSKKRGRLAVFDSDNIPPAVKAAVHVVGFDWLPRYDALKAGREPDRVLEERLRKKIAAIFSANGKQWVTAIADKRAPETEAAMDELRAEIATVLTRAAVDEAMAQAVIGKIDFDIAVVNSAAMEWAHKYTFELVKGIDRTTRRLISNATRQFMETPGMTVGQLTELIASPSITDVRAAQIAVTEVTRAYAQGTEVYQGMLKEAGIEMERVFNASGDEKVCDLCGPLNGRPESVWGDYGGPPLHVFCRCWLTLEYQKGK